MEVVSIWALILGVCGAIITVIGAIEKIMDVGKVVHEPNAEQDRRITTLENRCDTFDRYLQSDKQRITELEASLSMIMKVQFALLSHAINGNDLDKLKEVQSEMLTYLSQRGIHV